MVGRVEDHIIPTLQVPVTPWFSRVPGSESTLLCFVWTVNRFRQCVVVAITPAADRRLHPRFTQSLAIPDGDVLRTPVSVMDKAIDTSDLLVVQSLLQRIGHTGCLSTCA